MLSGFRSFMAAALLLGLACQGASAQGYLTSATVWTTPIVLGDPLAIDVSVWNGSESMYWGYTSVPSWRATLTTPSWTATWTELTWDFWDTVPSQGDAYETLQLTAGQLPTAPGAYSLAVNGYYQNGGLLSPMLSSPRTINFSIVVPTTATWTKGAGTLSWGTAGNWSSGAIPGSLDTARFTDAGIANGDQIALGGARLIKGLAFDATRNFTLGAAGQTLTLGSDGVVRAATAQGTQTIASPVAISGDTTWNIAGAGQLVLAGGLSGYGSLTKTGPGVLQLGGTIQPGSVKIRNGTLIANTNLTNLWDLILGDRYDDTGADPALLIAGPYTVGSVSVQPAMGTATLGGTNTTGTAVFSGGISLEQPVTLTAAAGGTVDFRGAISSFMGWEWTTTITGQGTVRFSGAASNTVADPTIVQSGVLALGKSSGKIAIAGNLTINGGAVRLEAAQQIADNRRVTVNQLGTLDLAGFNETIGSLAGNGGSVTLGGGTLTAGGDNATTSYAGAITGTGGVVKAGAGQMTLSAAVGNDYLGDTNVKAGILQVDFGVNANDTGLGDTTVGVGATQTATLIAPHVRQDVLMINAGSKVKISATGGASGTSVVNVLNIANTDGSFNWSSVGGAISPAATGGSLAGGAAVPEPATWLLAVIAALAGLIAWRRRK